MEFAKRLEQNKVKYITEIYLKAVRRDVRLQHRLDVLVQEIEAYQDATAKNQARILEIESYIRSQELIIERPVVKIEDMDPSYIEPAEEYPETHAS